MQKDLTKIKSQILFLGIYSFVLTITLASFLLSSFTNQQIISFEEIDVKRINIIEDDGTLRMTISNQEKSPAPTYMGDTFGMQGGNRCGLIFFNDESTECGGLIFEGKTNPKTNKYEAVGHLSFDQYNQNQVIYLQYADENGSKKTGLYINDWHDKPTFAEWNSGLREEMKAMKTDHERDSLMQKYIEPVPGEPAFGNRVFVGSDTAKNAVLNLADKYGKVRLQLAVNTDGIAKVNFFDAEGELLKSIGVD